MKNKLETFEVKITIIQRHSNPKDARNYMKNKTQLLEKSSEHIFYEIEMFYEAYKYFKKNNNYPRDIIEVFLLHSRNLFDFFYPPKSIYVDDICVFDFLDSYNEFNNNKTLKNNLNFNKEHINKFLTHLTYTRCNYDYKVWPCLDIGSKMIKTINAFYNALPDNYKNWDSFKKLKNLLNQNSND